MLALIPLDNRPCNLRFPSQIAAMGGGELVAPPEPLLGWFKTPGQPRAIADWLERLPEVEALIVSVDMLAYGGLVASRHPAVPEAEALRRLQALRQFRERRPQTPIYAFNILMRLAVTLDSDEAVANYYNVMRYARLADEAERFQSDYLREQLAAVTAEIPQAVLRDYLAARARNHAVNLHMIDWLAEGGFDYLLITQEDCTEFGLHRREQEALCQRIEERGVGDRAGLHPGADEAAMTLLARHWDTGVRLRVHWSDPEDARRIALFEDRPFGDALEQHVAAMRGQLVRDPGDFELFVNAPVGGWQKDETAAQRTARAARLQPFLRDLSQALREGRRVALCDVAFPNGADDLLLTELEKRGALSGLAVYAGWNTAGNTTGTVLAACAALWRNPDGTDAARQFLMERLLDDWFYQTHIRGRLERSAREKQLSPFNMEGRAGPMEAQVRRELRGFAQLLAPRHFGAPLRELEVSLPWHRSFEVDVRAQLGQPSAALNGQPAEPEAAPSPPTRTVPH